MLTALSWHSINSIVLAHRQPQTIFAKIPSACRSFSAIQRRAQTSPLVRIQDLLRPAAFHGGQEGTRRMSWASRMNLSSRSKDPHTGVSDGEEAVRTAILEKVLRNGRQPPSELMLQCEFAQQVSFSCLYRLLMLVTRRYNLGLRRYRLLLRDVKVVKLVEC